MQSLIINRTFGKFWAAIGLSNIGDGIANSALPLLAAMLTRDPALVAGFSFALTLPWLLFSLPIGALIDHMDRRRALVLAMALRMLLLVGLSLLIFTDVVQILWLYAFAFLYGTLDVVVDNANTTILPAMVERPQLESANSRVFAARFVGRSFFGPSIGGFLFAAFAGLPFLVHGGLLVFALALLAALRGTFHIQPAEQSHNGLAQNIGEGFSWLRDNRLLLYLAVVAGVLNMSGRAGRSVLVLYALDVLKTGEAGYGVLLSVAALGGLAGSLTATALSKRLGSGRAILLSVLLMGLSYPLTVAGSLAVVTGAALALRSFASLLWNVNVVSLRQAIVPDRLLGRVNSVYRLVGMGATPIGALLGGLLASQFGLRAPFLAGGVAVIITLLAILPRVNNRTVAEAKAAGPA